LSLTKHLGSVPNPQIGFLTLKCGYD
jgi:hypothetical protein